MVKRVLVYSLAAFIGVLLALATTIVFTITTVKGSGMEPLLEDGCKVLVNRLSFSSILSPKDSEPEVGNIVAVKNDVYGEEGEGRILVRRVAGKSGDTVEIDEGIFYLNGKPYDKYAKEPVHLEDMGKITLKDDEIFVLCDNRKSCMDSRNSAIGIVEMDDCIGKVCFGNSIL